MDLHAKQTFGDENTSTTFRQTNVVRWSQFLFGIGWVVLMQGRGSFFSWGLHGGLHELEIGDAAL